jgi:hypothetical protein
MKLTYITLHHLSVEYVPEKRKTIYSGKELIYPREFWLIGVDKQGKSHSIDIAARIAYEFDRRRLTERFAQKVSEACRQIDSVVIGIPDDAFAKIWVAPDFFEKLKTLISLSDRRGL